MNYFNIFFKTYSGCQLNCDHCMTNGKNGGNTVFNLEKSLDWFKRFDEYLPKTTRIHLDFFGGEPMLAPVEDLMVVRDFLRSLDREITLGMTTNLVYKLTDKKEEFIRSLDSVGTSWDPDIRFENHKQYQLWKENSIYLNNTLTNKMKINVSLSRTVLETNPADLLLFFIQMGFTTIAFDRITTDGLAIINDVIPSNKLVSNWYMRLHYETERRGLRELINNIALEDVYAKFENGYMDRGTFLRKCEQTIFTINSDGSISGCPNAALTKRYATIDDSMESLFYKPKRIEIISEESIRNENCYSCEIFDLCGSDCHLLAWNGNVCPAPKKLMFLLKERYKK